jgi:cytochrome c biogenesis protein CcdA
MSHLATVVALVALADSLNPSTIAPAVLLAAGRTPLRTLGGFIVGVSAVNFAAGVLVVLGPGRVLVGLVPHPEERTRHILELCVGVALVAAAFFLWLLRRGVARVVAASEKQIDRSSFLVGSGIMAVELPTAFPYFAALAVIVASGKALPVQVGLTLLFDLLFVLPLVLVLVVRLLFGARGATLLARFRTGLEARLATVLPIAVLVAGVALIGLGAYASA